MTKIEFCMQVGALAEQKYGVEDGADMCYHLMDMCIINRSQGMTQAAATVAQYIMQP